MSGHETPIRQPPAFQEYGADLLNLERIQLMSLAERGLLATLRWKIWANDSLPRDPELLSRLLGLLIEDVAINLTEDVLSFFAPAENDSTRIICPELADQKRRLAERHKKMAEGAKNSHKSRERGTHKATHAGTHSATHDGSGMPLSREEMKRGESKRTSSASKEEKVVAKGGNGATRAAHEGARL